jgi:hypothetical protein
MTPNEKQLISRLVKKYAEKIGTEYTIAFVAEQNGMLAACQKLLQHIESDQTSTVEWLQFECGQHLVDLHSFVQEITQITRLFKPRQHKEDHYAVLGLAEGAGREEIKLAYRRLSKKYHPDTANPEEGDTQEKFIDINKAYHTLLEQQSTKQISTQEQETTGWRKRKKPAVSDPQKKQFFKWSLGLLAILVVLSVIASNSFRKRAMITGLRESKRPAVAAAQNNTVDSETPGSIPITPSTPETIAVPDSTPTEQWTENIADREMPPKILLERNPHTKGIDAEAASLENPTPADTFNNTPNPEPKVTAKEPVPPEQAVYKAESNDASQPDIIEQKTTTARSREHVAPPADKLPRLTVAPSPQVKNPPLARPQPQAQAQPEPQKQPQPQAETTSAETNLTTAQQPNADTIFKPTSEVHQKPDVFDLQKELDDFLQNYIDAYEQRNLILFARIFEADATENGVPFKDGMSDYSELFARTSEVSLQVDRRSFKQNDNLITVEARFTINLHYNNGNLFSGTGPIHFLLVKHKDELLIKDIQYAFE